MLSVSSFNKHFHTTLISQILRSRNHLMNNTILKVLDWVDEIVISHFQLQITKEVTDQKFVRSPKLKEIIQFCE